jgi:hypothetical protein
MKTLSQSISAYLLCEIEVYNFVILEYIRNNESRNHENFPVTSRAKGKNILTKHNPRIILFVLVKKNNSSNKLRNLRY